MKIKLTICSDEYSATLNSSKAATDFLALLPTTLMLKDYAGTEKISDLPVRLNTAESPEGTAAAIGDIAYYAPWGNLAVFYRDSGYAPGLIKLGSIDAGGKKLASYKQPIEARLDVFKKETD